MANVPELKEELSSAVKGILSGIERPREAEVIDRRFGISGQKETLEQVGESLSITRERVRQIEKATLLRIKISLDDNKNPDYISAERDLVKTLHEMGRGARIDDLADRLMGDHSVKSRAVVTLLAELSSKMVITTENDKYYAAVILSSDKDERDIKKAADAIVATLRKHGQPVTIDELYKLVNGDYEHPMEVAAIASISKNIATLNGMWGLVKWPLVNPRNIRDKIYVVLKQHDKPMHFNDIADAVKAENFKRNNVTKQAIHNELIKDNRFVLVGRGIYALAERGYKRGSITDVISDILRENGPMNREDIVRAVLKVRQVREATVLLNLSRPQFKRIDKSTYTLTNA